ncbi:MAG: thiol reductant ABC exporter subunit CydD [Cardiobacteriaceae bacterium]|nr:thiol reductant ABC exporter subunit CydD [Cardiobacteriaceae bacterium]
MPTHSPNTVQLSDKEFLRNLLIPEQKSLRLALILALLAAAVIILQNALLSRLFANWLDSLRAFSGEIEVGGAFIDSRIVEVTAKAEKTPSAIAELKYFLPFLCVFLLLRPVLNYAKEQILQAASFKLRTNLRSRLLKDIAILGLEKRAIGSDGAISTIILEQVDALDGYISRYAVQQKLAMAMPVMIVFSVAIFSPFAALLLLLTAPLVPLFMILFGRAAGEQNRLHLAALARLGGSFLDLLRGNRTLRRLNAQDAAVQTVSRNSYSYRDRTMSVLRLAFLSSAVLELFASLAIALVAVYLGLGLIGVLPWAKGEVPVAYQGALFILLLAPEFYAPLRQLGADYHDKAKAQAAVNSLRKIIERAENLAAIQGTIELDGTNPPEITIRDLTIHGDGERIRLKLNNLEIKSGERVLLQGESGSGKSSLLQALLGFLPYDGEIKISGYELSELNIEKFRKTTAYLAQTPPILAGTIAENLRLPKPEATEDELWQVLRQVEISDLVMQLPEKLNTKLGERGQGLSGGQLQRLAIAQMLLSDANFWLLDEPTEHLDPQTAKEICDLLDRTSKNKTLLFVSHTEDYLEFLEKRIFIGENLP